MCKFDNTDIWSNWFIINYAVKNPLREYKSMGKKWEEHVRTTEGNKRIWIKDFTVGTTRYQSVEGVCVSCGPLEEHHIFTFFIQIHTLKKSYFYSLVFTKSYTSRFQIDCPNLDQMLYNVREYRVRHLNYLSEN